MYKFNKNTIHVDIPYNRPYNSNKNFIIAYKYLYEHLRSI
jgi:hypothetical protein